MGWHSASRPGLNGGPATATREVVAVPGSAKSPPGAGSDSRTSELDRHPSQHPTRYRRACARQHRQRGIRGPLPPARKTSSGQPGHQGQDGNDDQPDKRATAVLDSEAMPECRSSRAAHHGCRVEPGVTTKVRAQTKDDSPPGARQTRSCRSIDLRHQTAVREPRPAVLSSAEFLGPIR